MKTTQVFYEKYYEKLFKRVQEASALKVPLTYEDRTKYKELFEDNPKTFFKNATKDFYLMMRHYIKTGKVWRVNCAGKTRHGKSEVAQTWTMIYIDCFNELMLQGVFDGNEKQGINYKLEVLKKFTTADILTSQNNHLYHLREQEKKNELIYGKPTIVDEDRPSSGGLGSYTERVEIENAENITAQAMQSEWQLRPDKFVLINAPYCLFQEKMDFKNKTNWSMLYQVRIDPTVGKPYIFEGWVATPLHEDNDLRIAYNKKKRENIRSVFEGKGDLRLVERQSIALKLSKDEDFSARSSNGAIFKYSKSQQECVLNEWISAGKCSNFNMMEKIEIIDYARLLAEREYDKKNGGVRNGIGNKK